VDDARGGPLRGDGGGDTAPEAAAAAPLAPTGAELTRLRTLTGAKWSWHDDDVMPAWVADMDFAPAPAVVAAVRALVDRGDFGYNFAAQARLCEAFAQWQERRHGWSPDPARVRVFCDVVQAIEAALWVHTERGDGVVVFTPIYPPFLSSVETMGRRIVDCPLDPQGWRIDPERLEGVIDDTTRVVLLCSPHNPTGRAFDRTELEAVADLAERRDLLVISDEIWGDLVYPGRRHVPFASLGDEIAERTVTVTAASKAFNLAGLRCAVAHIGHAGVAEGLAALPSHLLGAVGSPGAEATLAAWTQGEEWLEATRDVLLGQRDHLAHLVRTRLGRAVWTPPEATYLAWLDLGAWGLSVDPSEYLLERARVALSTGPDFGPGGTGFVRLNFATSRSLLDEIVDRVSAALGEAGSSAGIGP